MKISRLFTKLFHFFLAVIIAILLLSQIGWGTIQASANGFCWVDKDATGLNNGSSWADAFTDLQSALGQPACLEIWVAEGVYKPTSGTSRTASFILPNGVAVYGGFAGTETDRSQRAPSTYLTVLSGDVDNNDSQKPVIYDFPSVTGNTTNSYHVVLEASGATATLDGFTITAGYANGVSPDNQGGGLNNAGTLTLNNVHHKGNFASTGGGIYNTGTLTITNSSFIANQAYKFGGGMLAHGGSVDMSNVTFQNNVAQSNYTSGPVSGGGAIQLENNGSLTVSYSLFVTNSSMGNGAGGAILISGSTATVTTSSFYTNHAEQTGGAIYNGYTLTMTDSTLSGNSAVYMGGAIDNSQYLYLTNSTLTNNSAKFGGAIYDSYAYVLKLINNTFSGNTAYTGIGGIGGNLNVQHEASLDYANNIIANSSATGGDCVFTAVTVTRNLNNLDSDHTCNAGLTGDPLLGSLVNNGGSNSTMAIPPGSPAIDAGDDAVCAAAPVNNRDQRYLLRPRGFHCDIGAYEAQLHSIPLVVGWNLVSFNLHPTSTAISDVLASVDGIYDLVYAWDASGSHSATGNWMRYSPSIPVGNTLTTLDETQGFWIRMTSAGRLDITGASPAISISLVTGAGGWNLVGYPLVASHSLPDALSLHGVPTNDFSLVYAYHADDSADPWKRYAVSVPVGNDLAGLAPGRGYWIKVSVDHSGTGAWIVP